MRACVFITRVLNSVSQVTFCDACVLCASCTTVIIMVNAAAGGRCIIILAIVLFQSLLFGSEFIFLLSFKFFINSWIMMFFLSIYVSVYDDSREYIISTYTMVILIDLLSLSCAI